MKRSSKIAMQVVTVLGLGLAAYAAVAQPFGMGAFTNGIGGIFGRRSLPPYQGKNDFMK